MIGTDGRSVVGPKPKPILDDTGKVREWMRAGRGVRVWTCIDMSSQRLGEEMLTPGDVEQKPHWSYEDSGAVLDEADLTFYEPFRIEQSWTDSPSGVKAADNAMRTTYHSETFTEGLGGRWGTRYTLIRFGVDVCYTGIPHLDPPRRSDGRSLLHEYRVGVLSWTAKLAGPPA